MNILKAIFFGLIEGLTEWLPISSSTHIELADQILKMNASEGFFSGLNSYPVFTKPVSFKLYLEAIEINTGHVISLERLNVQPARTYVKYCEIEHWGWNNMNF